MGVFSVAIACCIFSQLVTGISTRKSFLREVQKLLASKKLDLCGLESFSLTVAEKVDAVFGLTSNC